MIDVCICTHNPRMDVLASVIESIADQNGCAGLFSVLLVDNASAPPISAEVLDVLVSRDIPARIVVEDALGIARARLRAIEETKADWLLFVDDDNVLDMDYIAEGVAFINAHDGKVGCFGGKLLLPSSIKPPLWASPFLPFLAIKDIGDDPAFGSGKTWDPSEPPTAGAMVHRLVLNQYRDRSRHVDISKLGRIGTAGLISCEDSLLMRGVWALGLSTAYNPKMILRHILDMRRFRIGYLIRLMYSYGISHVRLNCILDAELKPPPSYLHLQQFVRLLASEMSNAGRKSFAFGLGIGAYHVGARGEYLRQEKAKQNDRR